MLVGRKQLFSGDIIPTSQPVDNSACILFFVILLLQQYCSITDLEGPRKTLPELKHGSYPSAAAPPAQPSLLLPGLVTWLLAPPAQPTLLLNGIHDSTLLLPELATAGPCGLRRLLHITLTPALGFSSRTMLLGETDFKRVALNHLLRISTYHSPLTQTFHP